MKKTSLSLLFGVLGCMISFTLPTFGVHMSSSPVRDEPDTVYTDTLEEGDPEALDSIWVEDFEETFEDSVVVDNASMVESGVCEPNYELLGEMDEKMADFSLSHSKDANFGISFSASIFTPTTIKKGSPYHRMVADILNATMPETDEPVKFESRDIERMLELKWRTLKERYEFETTDLPPLIIIIVRPSRLLGRGLVSMEQI